MSEESHNFNRFQTLLWPIHRYELRKLLPMLLVFFLIALNYNILRNMKDALIITQRSSGAEVIPFIKVWVMLPTAIFLIFLFTRLSHWFNAEQIFYCIITLFLTYFLIFTFLIYPYREALSLHEFADRLQGTLPSGCKGLIAMIRYWHFTSFYTMAEMWSNIVLSTLFWAFANEITKIGEAKRFYGIFGLGANVASIAAGQISLSVCHLEYKPYLYGDTSWEQTLVVLVLLVTVIGIITMAIYRWMHKEILTDTSLYEHSESVTAHRSKKPKMSMRENFSCLIQSKYVFCIAFIVIVYNSIINLLEVIWKDHVRQLYPSPVEFAAYMNKVTIWTGVVAFVVAMLVTGNALRRLGWTKTAIMTPFVLLLTTIGFFTFIIFGDDLSGAATSILGITPLAITVFLGSAQNVMSRAAKYTVFDATKELAFIPLSQKIKLRAKTSIDGVGSRLGKSSGSVVYQILLLTFSSLSASISYVAGILLLLLGGWIIAVKSLGRQFNQLSTKKNHDPARPNDDDTFPEQETKEPCPVLKQQAI